MRVREWVPVVVAAFVLVAGCAGPVAGEPAGPPGEPGAFPVTVPHGQGEAVVPGPPQRVVVLGAGDEQIATALGAPIVGAVRNPVSDDGGWLGVDPPRAAEVGVLDSIEPDLEAIAALRPDLILMTTAQPSFAAVHPQIAAIAPTVSYRTELLQDPGDELTRMIGAALGKPAEAQDLIDRSAAAIDRFVTEHPAPGSYLFGQFVGGTAYLVTAPHSPSVEFFERLGATPEPQVAALPLWQAGMVALADEQLPLIGAADLVIIGTPTADDERALRTHPLVERTPAAAQGRLHVVSADIAALLLTPNPASVPVLLETLRPILEAT